MSTPTGVATSHDPSATTLTAAPAEHQGIVVAAGSAAGVQEKNDGAPAAEAPQEPMREYLKGWRLYMLTFAYVTLSS